MSYRSCVMMLSFFALGRADLGEPVKCLARSMAKPTPGSFRDLKKGARFLLGTKLLALHSWRQTFPKCSSTYVDSDFAGCCSTRRSTTGMVQIVGGHAVKHTSDLQGATGLSVSECEYYALTHGAAHGVGLRSYMADLGFEMSLEMLSDSSATRAFASRRCVGRQRHVQTRYLWLQERVAAAHLSQYKRSKPCMTSQISSQRQQAEKHGNGTRETIGHMSTVVRRNSDLKVSSTVIQCSVLLRQTSQCGTQLVVWIFEFNQRSVQSGWILACRVSLPSDTMWASGC